jgi:glycosyltransferase involved in cell wall biosynthesis
MGLPVVCPDHYGFSDAINSSCGIKVGTGSLEAISGGIATALRGLHDDESERQRLASGALERAGHFSWQETGKLVSHLYESRVR